VFEISFSYEATSRLLLPRRRRKDLRPQLQGIRPGLEFINEHMPGYNSGPACYIYQRPYFLVKEKSITPPVESKNVGRYIEPGSLAAKVSLLPSSL